MTLTQHVIKTHDKRDQTDVYRYHIHSVAWNMHSKTVNSSTVTILPCINTFILNTLPIFLIFPSAVFTYT